MTEQLLIKAVPNIKELILILIQQISVNKTDEPSVSNSPLILVGLLKQDVAALVDEARAVGNIAVGSVPEFGIH